jgi:hypothetical protein
VGVKHAFRKDPPSCADWANRASNPARYAGPPKSSAPRCVGKLLGPNLAINLANRTGAGIRPGAVCARLSRDSSEPLKELKELADGIVKTFNVVSDPRPHLVTSPPLAADVPRCFFDQPTTQVGRIRSAAPPPLAPADSFVPNASI